MSSPQRTRPASSLATQYAPPLDLPFRFLVTGLGALALLVVLSPWLTPLLLGGFYDWRLLAFVHLNTLGVIGATVFGASFQLLPVVVQAPLASVRLARLAWWLYLPGLLAFLLGLALVWVPLLAAGGTLLFLAVMLYVGVAFATLLRAPHRDVVFWHIAAAVLNLAVGASLGLLLALNKQSGMLSSLTLPILAAHVVLLLGGWVTPMLAGVAYRLVAMFTLSEDHVRRDWAWAELVLTVGGAWLLAADLLYGLGLWPGIAGTAALLAGFGLFAAQLVHLYRVRRRRTFDVHIPFALAAASYGVLAAGLALWGFVAGYGPGHPVWMAATWLAIAGWAETAIQGFLYKIGTFLTWLHRYAPLAGRQPVPKLEDLYGRRTALVGWAGWMVGVALGALAPLTGLAWLAYAAAAGLSLGGAAFLVNVRRVGAHWR